VKIERNPDIQKMLCNAVGRMIALLLSENREPLKDLCGKVAAKIVRNCCAFVCSLPTETFLASDLKWKEKSDNAICRLDRDELEQSDDSLEVIRNNGAMILAELSALFQSKLFSEVPAILEVVEEGLLAADLSSEALEVAWDQQAQPLLNSLQILKVLVSFLPADLLNSHFCSRYGYLKRVVKLVNSPWTAIRYMSSSFFAQLLQRCNQLTSTPIKFEISPMLILIEEILPLLSDPISPCNRVAAAELIWLVLEKLDMHILPYLVFFLVPILGRMSDQHDHVRQTVTNSFSRLVRLMPLEVYSTSICVQTCF
jgi:TATA-binding protein-associated factor